LLFSEENEDEKSCNEGDRLPGESSLKCGIF